MNAFVTGATGFVGAHLVRALLGQGASVKCLVRAASRTDNIDGLSVDVVRGDLTDAASIRDAVNGAEVVYHCAADYRLYVRRPELMYAANVGGTNNVLQAAADCGVRRVVYTSTVGALGLDPAGLPADETLPVSIEDMIGHYKRSKFMAERVADNWIGKGLPVVIVNPSAPVGDLDVKPTATGQMILDFLNGKLTAYVDTGLNLVDVRDVAQGHLLAAEKGLVGEKYILGHRDMSLKQILDALSAISGIRSPRLRLPHLVPLAFAALDTFAARLLHRRPRLALDAVKLSRHKMYFDAGKAVRELGLPQSPIEAALQRAVEWFRTNDYVGKRAAA
jgi:dihydroflavonol-4-reductase